MKNHVRKREEMQMEQCNLLIEDTTVMTDAKTILKGMDIAVCGDKIAAVVKQIGRASCRERVCQYV